MGISLPQGSIQFPQELLQHIIHEDRTNFDKNVSHLFTEKRDILDSFNTWSLKHPAFANSNPLMNRIKKISNGGPAHPIQQGSSQPDPSEITEFQTSIKLLANTHILRDHKAFQEALPLLETLSPNQRTALYSAEEIADGLEALFFRSPFIFSLDTSNNIKQEYQDRKKSEFADLIPKLCDTQKVLELVKIFIKRLPDQPSYASEMKSQQQFAQIIYLVISSSPPDDRAFIYEELLKEKLWKSENNFIKSLLTSTVRRDPEYDLQGYISGRGEIEANGQQVIVEYLQEKGSLPKEIVAVYDYIFLLKNKLDAISKDPQIDEFYFLFGTGHTTPIYIKKIEGKWVALITDSIGEDQYGLCTLLKRYLSTEVIYFSTYKRQEDWVACAIFAIRDLVQIYRHREEILSFFSKQLSEKDENTSIKSVNVLPPYLMKTTHSLTKMNKFFAETGSGSQISSRSETYAKNLEKHTRTGQNKLIEDRAAKYWELIIQRILKKRKTLK